MEKKDIIDILSKLDNYLADMEVRAGEMARGACRNGEFYWLAKYDTIREIKMDLPKVLSDFT